jgi:GNAT superfamily N-acetyltransferase
MDLSDSNSWRKQISLSTDIITSKGLKIKVSLSQKAPSDDGYVGGRIFAFVGDTEVGYMPYGGEEGTDPHIGDLVVSQRYRRKGIASSMLKFARDNGIPLRHYPNADDMSSAGRAFAMSEGEKTSFLLLMDKS